MKSVGTLSENPFWNPLKAWSCNMQQKKKIMHTWPRSTPYSQMERLNEYQETGKILSVEKRWRKREIERLLLLTWVKRTNDRLNQHERRHWWCVCVRATRQCSAKTKIETQERIGVSEWERKRSKVKTNE